MRYLNFQQIPDSYTICKSTSELDVFTLCKASSIFALIRDDIETTIVLKKNVINQTLSDNLVKDENWIMFRIKGEFAFGETGIIVSAISPLSNNNIGVFVISTYSSDLLMIKKTDLERAITYLKSAGHTIL